MTEQQTVQISARDDIEVRLPKNIYTSFVNEDKFRSDMTIGASSIDQIEILSTAQGNAQTNSTLFKTQLQPGMLYSNQAILQSDIAVTYTNIRIPEDYQMVMSTSTAPGGLNQQGNSNFDFFVTPKEGGASTQYYAYDPDGKVDNTKTGFCANPFQAPLTSFCTDILNTYLGATTRVDLTTNGASEEMQTDAAFHDLRCRFYDKDYVEDNWSGTLMANKRMSSGQQVLAFTKRYPMLSSDGIYGHTASATLTTGEVTLFDQAHPTLLDLEHDDYVTSNRKNRGRLDDEVLVSNIYKKALPSPNFTLTYTAGDEIAWKLATTPYTNDLYEVRFRSGFRCQTNIILPFRKTDGDYWYAILGDMLFWYYNSLNKISVYTAAVGPPANGKITYTCNEPADQSLTIIKTYHAIRSPLFNPLLTQLQSDATFSNTTSFTCNLTKTGDILSCIRYCGDLILGTQASEGVVGVSFANFNTKLYLTQFGLDLMGSSIKPVTKLFYNAYGNPATTTQTIQIKEDMQEVTLSMPIQSIGDDVPSSTIFYVDGLNCAGVEIVSIRAKINGSSIGLSARTEDDLFRLTKENGLVNYSVKDYRGYPFMYENVQNAATIGRGSIVCINQSEMGFNKQILNIGAITGAQITVSYDVVIRIPILNNNINDLVYPRLVIYHQTKSSLRIEKSNGFKGKSLFSQTECLKAIENFQNQADGNKLHLSTRRFYSGGSIFSFLSKAKNIIPKIYNTVKDVSNAAAKTANVIGNTANAVHGATKKFSNFF